MLGPTRRGPHDGDPDLRKRLIGVYAVLIGANLGAWIWALVALRDHPVLLGTALLAYTFGLRHAVDADHIAAIDNVTRKLMQQGQRPVGVGFFFSLGHSAVVVAMSFAVAVSTSTVLSRFESFRSAGGMIAAAVSASFLFVLAAFNVTVLVSVHRTFRAVRRGGAFAEQDFDVLLNGRGVLARLFRPLFGLVTEGWHLVPIGFLFGLGFDTATEVALFGISAAQASSAMSLGVILVFPALFTAAMSLADTTDGVLMLGAYGWAFERPIRKLYYNMTITAVSVVVAVLIGGVEMLGLLGDKLRLEGRFWDAIAALNGNFGLLGCLIIGVFVLSWLASVLIYRVRGYDDLAAPAGRTEAPSPAGLARSQRPRGGEPRATPVG